MSKSPASAHRVRGQKDRKPRRAFQPLMAFAGRVRRSLRNRTSTNNRALGTLADEAGSMLVELSVGGMILSVVAVGFAANLGAALKVQSTSRERVVAEQLASQRTEQVRGMVYTDIGVTSGNPPGTLPPSENVVVSGVTYARTTKVSYVNDAIPGGFSTSANYKLVTVTVTTPLRTTPLATFQTKVAPPIRPDLTKGVIEVTVFDYALSSPVEDANVSLLLGPSAPRSDDTGADGKVGFAALDAVTTSKPYYDLTVTKTDLATGKVYETLKEDLPPASAAHVALGATQLFPTVLRIYLPASIHVKLVDTTGNPFTSPVNVTVSSSRGSGVFSVTGGQGMITTVAGEKLVPSVDHTVTPALSSYTITPQSRILQSGMVEVFTFTVTPA